VVKDAGLGALKAGDSAVGVAGRGARLRANAARLSYVLVNISYGLLHV
jgi:hypothetical protein